MKFEALEVAIQLAQALRHILEQLRRHDADLADQARRGTTSAALSISEARSRIGRDRAHLFRVGLGSVSEVDTALRLATAWGFLEEADLVTAFALCDRLRAMLWRLTR